MPTTSSIRGIWGSGKALSWSGRKATSLKRARRGPGWLLWLALAPAAGGAGPPAAWIPARWDGGPVELARRAGDKALANPDVRETISRWYDPATLSLLDGTPVNCLLLTLSAGAGPEIEKRQQQLVTEYARRARERGL